MKTLIKVPVHSVVDLITNSSSELFICHRDKSLETVKALLFGIVEIYIDKQELKGEPREDASVLFERFFGDVKECPYNFEPAEYPEYDLYRQTNEWDFFRDDPLYRSAFDAWSKHSRERSKAGHQDFDREGYERIMGPWNKRQQEEKLKLLRWAFKHNNLEWDYNPDTDLKYKNNEFDKKADWFLGALAWGYTLYKGDVFVESNGDNSIPFELFDLIEDVLNAHRRHLG